MPTTATVRCDPTKDSGFWKWDEGKKWNGNMLNVRLTRPDDIESQQNNDAGDPWANFPTLKKIILQKRSDEETSLQCEVQF